MDLHCVGVVATNMQAKTAGSASRAFRSRNTFRWLYSTGFELQNSNTTLVQQVSHRGLRLESSCQGFCAIRLIPQYSNHVIVVGIISRPSHWGCSFPNSNIALRCMCFQLLLADWWHMILARLIRCKTQGLMRCVRYITFLLHVFLPHKYWTDSLLAKAAQQTLYLYLA